MNKDSILFFLAVLAVAIVGTGTVWWTTQNESGNANTVNVATTTPSKGVASQESRSVDPKEEMFPAPATPPLDFAFAYTYGYGNVVDTFSGTYTKFEGEGAKPHVANYRLSTQELTSVYKEIIKAGFFTDALVVTLPEPKPGQPNSLIQPCDDRSLKVRTNGITKEFSWNCNVNTDNGKSKIEEFDTFMDTILRPEYNSLPAPTGGLPQ